MHTVSLAHLWNAGGSAGLLEGKRTVGVDEGGAPGDLRGQVGDGVGPDGRHRMGGQARLPDKLLDLPLLVLLYVELGRVLQLTFDLDENKKCYYVNN